ncbi:MAG: hypothetical protein AAGK66_00745 [Pseudomonadota bacterium]
MLKVFAAGLASVFLIAGSAYANGPLKSTLEAYIVGTDEDGAETLTPTEEITPGETIEYVLTYENLSENDLNGLVISAPIPASTTFVVDSQTEGTESVFEVSADDGATWGEVPLMRSSDDGEVEVPISEYDVVRWVPSGAIEAGESWRFEYRTSVD